MPSASSPEAAVRRYLQWLDDPSSLVDADAVARAEAAVAAAPDPLARLHALADLEHAREADSDAATKEFVANARAYAEAESIPVAAFQASGASDDVLRRAGFQVGRRGRRSSGGASRRGGRARATQVSTETLKAAVLRLPRPFTLSEVANEAGGGSPQTVRKAVDEMVAAGKVRNLGPKQDHQGQGRAPTLYELA